MLINKLKKFRNILGNTFFNSKSYKYQIDKKELKKKLSHIEYHVTQEKGTEQPFTGDYLNFKEKGFYYCIICDIELFNSEYKYDSRSGWPSFYEANKQNIKIEIDNQYNMSREEVLCNNCGSHLGHVFNDGPNPTGRRFCINSASISFKQLL